MTPLVIGITYTVPTVVSATRETASITLAVEKYEWFTHLVTFLTPIGYVVIWLLEPPHLQLYKHVKTHIDLHINTAALIITAMPVSLVFYLTILSMANHAAYNYGVPLFVYTSLILNPTVYSALFISNCEKRSYIETADARNYLAPHAGPQSAGDIPVETTPRGAAPDFQQRDAPRVSRSPQARYI